MSGHARDQIPEHALGEDLGGHVIGSGRAAQDELFIAARRVVVQGARRRAGLLDHAEVAEGIEDDRFVALARVYQLLRHFAGGHVP